MKRKDRIKARKRAKQRSSQEPTWADYAEQIEDEPDFIAHRFISLRRCAEEEFLIAALSCPECSEGWGPMTRFLLKSGWIECEICKGAIHVDRIEVEDETNRVITLGVLMRSSLEDRYQFAKYQYFLARCGNDGKPID